MFRRTLLRTRSPIIWRSHRIDFHRNMQTLPNLQQQGIAAGALPNSSVGQASTAPQDKTHDQTDSLLLNQSEENTLTDHGDSNDTNSITFNEIDSRLRKLESYFQIREQEMDDIGESESELGNDLYEWENYRDRVFAGGVVSIRNQLAQMFLSSTQNARQQIANPIDVLVKVCDKNEVACDVNLLTTINQADRYPAYFDMCLDTVFGAPKNLINRLLKWDKAREYQVYRIFGDHGEAWHRSFANTCPKPFKTWLTSIICLQKLESDISHDTSPDLEILIQNQKEQVKKSIQEWDEAYTTDRSNCGKKREECRKIIVEDYRERGLIASIKENLFHGVKLDQ